MFASHPPLGPAPLLGYVDSPIDRCAERRNDAAFLAAAAADPATRCYVVAGELILLLRQDNAYQARFSPTRIKALGKTHERVFLGLENNAARFGVLLDGDSAVAAQADPDLFVSDLRSIAVQGLVPHDQLAGIAATKAMLHWHARHRFCSACGAPTRPASAGWKRDCPACGTEDFPRTDPVVIMLAIHGDRCLLGRQARFPDGMWSCLAGFVEPGETFEEAVRRETREEAGIVTARVRYLASQPWPFPMSVMIGCLAEAVSEDIAVDTTELVGARWIDRHEAALMLTRTHPDGVFCPPPIAIAHHLIRAFVEGERP